MIVVKLMGGLGNQMFQYATGRALAHRLNAPVFTDHSFLEMDPKGAWTKRNFELDIFKTIPAKVSSYDLEPFQKIAASRVKRKLSKMAPSIFGNYTFYKEYGFEFHPEFNSLKGHVYLDGYWQSPRYFSAIREILLKEFSFKSEPNEESKSLSEKINATDSISLHVRRADYITDKKVLAYHGICSVDYYLKAVEVLSSGKKNPHIFIFSDDPVWVKENIALKIPSTVVSGNTGKSSYEDMRLMSLCHSNVIANSSFSWWGAWLNNFPEKKVIAPTHWFASDKINTSDLYPSEWMKL